MINFVSIVMNELCFIYWSVWKQHGNTVLFEGKRKNVMLMGSKAVAAFKEFYRGKPQCQGSQLRRVGDPVFMTGWAIGFFDRVSQDWFQKYEAGAVRFVEDGKQYKIQLKLEPIPGASWWPYGTCYFARSKNLLYHQVAATTNLLYFQVARDLNFIIYWSSWRCNLQVLALESWIINIRRLQVGFNGISFQHIFKASIPKARRLHFIIQLWFPLKISKSSSPEMIFQTYMGNSLIVFDSG